MERQAVTTTTPTTGAAAKQPPSRFPREGDLVICEISSIQSHCAFAKLKEYEGLEGMIHISEVSSSWIKNIRTFVREGKEVVCKVMSIDPIRRHISLSIRRVSEAEKGDKYDQLKRERKSVKMLERVSEKLDGKMDLGDLREKLIKKFGEVYYGFEEAARTGAPAMAAIGISEREAWAIAEIAKASIVFPEVSIGGIITIQSYAPDGIEMIKTTLSKVESMGAQVHYISAPNYGIKVVAHDYKSAEKVLKAAVDFAHEKVKKSGGTCEFARSQKE